MLTGLGGVQQGTHANVLTGKQLTGYDANLKKRKRNIYRKIYYCHFLLYLCKIIAVYYREFTAVVSQ